MAQPTNDNDLRDTMLEVVAAVQETMREVEQEMATPKIMEAVLEAWMTTPPEMKERFKKEKPKEYEALMDLMK